MCIRRRGVVTTHIKSTINQLREDYKTLTVINTTNNVKFYNLKILYTLHSLNRNLDRDTGVQGKYTSHLKITHG